MNLSPTAAARAADRMHTLARRTPTPAMLAKGAAIGRKLDEMKRRGSGPLVVGCAGMSFAEAARIASDAERKMRLARDLPPFHALSKEA